MALLPIDALRSDPVLNHNFVVSLIDTSSVLSTVLSSALSAVLDVAVGGFAECSGLEMSMKVQDYEEGGNNGTVLKFPGRISWANLVLKRGVATNTTLWDWHYSFVEGRGKRRDGLIVLMTELHVPNNIWYFRKGLPMKYTGPAMNATQNLVSVEQMEIAHHGLYQLPGVGLGSGLASAIAGGGFGGLVEAAGSLGGRFI